MTLDEITKAASDRLAALDAEAKPHEAALVAINAERDRLRSVIVASRTATVHAPIWVNPAPGPFAPFPIYPPVIEPWSPAPQRYTDIIITTTASSGLTFS